MIHDVFVDTLLYSWWVNGPLYLVWLAGIAWAAATWRRHPRKSLLTMLALGWFLIGPLVLSMVMQCLYGGSEIWMTFGFFHSAINAGVWLLLFAAIFLVDCQPPAPRGPDGEIAKCCQTQVTDDKTSIPALA